MGNTLQRRVARLESGTADAPGLVISWTLDEEVNIVECNDQIFTRREGEDHEKFMKRILETLSPAPGNVLWLEESAA